MVDNIEQAVKLLRQELDKIEQEYRHKREAIDTSIELLLKGRSNDSISNTNADSPSGSVVTGRRARTHQAIVTAGRFVHNVEIAQAIIDTDEIKDIDTLKRAISTALRGLTKQKKVISVGESKKKTFWGLPQWLDKSGKLKEGYENKMERTRWSSSNDTN